jgi:hypothetical protein
MSLQDRLIEGFTRGDINAGYRDSQSSPIYDEDPRIKKART